MFNRTGLFLGALAFAAAFFASSETLAEEEVTATPAAKGEPGAEATVADGDSAEEATPTTATATRFVGRVARS